MLADCSNRSPTGSLSFFSWNINGIFAKPLGDKLQNNECLNLIKGGNFIYPMMHRFILYYQAFERTWSISSTGTLQLNNGGKRLVLPIKPSVPLLCRSIYDFRSTIPNISLVKSKRVFGRLLLVNYCNCTGAPNEHFSENEPLTTENENLDAFKAFSSAFLCCWKEFICSSLPAG